MEFFHLLINLISYFQFYYLIEHFKKDNNHWIQTVLSISFDFCVSIFSKIYNVIPIDPRYSFSIFSLLILFISVSLASTIIFDLSHITSINISFYLTIISVPVIVGKIMGYEINNLLLTMAILCLVFFVIKSFLSMNIQYTKSELDDDLLNIIYDEIITHEISAYTSTIAFQAISSFSVFKYLLNRELKSIEKKKVIKIILIIFSITFCICESYAYFMTKNSSFGWFLISSIVWNFVLFHIVVCTVVLFWFSKFLSSKNISKHDILVSLLGNPQMDTDHATVNAFILKVEDYVLKFSYIDFSQFISFFYQIIYYMPFVFELLIIPLFFNFFSLLEPSKEVCPIGYYPYTQYNSYFLFQNNYSCAICNYSSFNDSSCNSLCNGSYSLRVKNYPSILYFKDFIIPYGFIFICSIIFFFIFIPYLLIYIYKKINIYDDSNLVLSNFYNLFNIFHIKYYYILRYLFKIIFIILIILFKNNNIFLISLFLILSIILIIFRPYKKNLLNFLEITHCLSILLILFQNNLILKWILIVFPILLIFIYKKENDDIQLNNKILTKSMVFDEFILITIAKFIYYFSPIFYIIYLIFKLPYLNHSKFTDIKCNSLK